MEINKLFEELQKNLEKELGATTIKAIKDGYHLVNLSKKTAQRHSTAEAYFNYLEVYTAYYYFGELLKDFLNTPKEFSFKKILKQFHNEQINYGNEVIEKCLTYLKQNPHLQNEEKANIYEQIADIYETFNLNYAEKYYKLAIKNIPQNAGDHPHTMLGFIYYRKKNYAKAVFHLKKVFTLVKSIKIAGDIAQIYEKTNNLNTAFKYYNFQLNKLETIKKNHTPKNQEQDIKIQKTRKKLILKVKKNILRIKIKIKENKDDKRQIKLF